MKRIATQFTPTFTSKEAKYVGKPLEHLQQTNQILDARYRVNKQEYENQVDVLANTEVEDHNREFVNNRSKVVKDAFAESVRTNNFEFADRTVSDQARGINNDKYLKGSIQSKAAYDAHGTALAKKLEANKINSGVANALRAEGVASNSKRINVTENGVIENVYNPRRIVDDPDITKQVKDMSKMLKASSKPITLTNGKHMWSEGGQWRVTGQEESINNAVAEKAIQDMVMSDPKNQDWFAQSNRLEDNAEIVRNEDGTYMTDKDGAYVRDTSKINYRDKMGTIIPTKDIPEFLAKMSELNPSINYNQSTMTNEDFEILYKNQRNAQRVASTAAAGVNLVDFYKKTIKLQSDPLYVARIKRTWARADELADMRSGPKVYANILNKNDLAKTGGELVVKRSGYEASYNKGMATLTALAKDQGLEGTVTMTENGLMLKAANGTMTPLNKDEDAQINSFYRQNVKSDYDKIQQADKMITTFMGTMSDAEKKGLNDEIVSQLKSKAFSPAGKAMWQDMPDAVYERAAKEGIIDLPEGVTWKQYVANMAGGAAVGGAAGAGLFSIPTAAAGAIAAAIGTSVVDNFGYTNVKLKAGKTDEDLLKFILNDSQGQKAAANVTNDYLSNGNNAELTARFDQSLQNIIDVTSNVYAKGVQIGNGAAVANTKGASKANYDRGTAITNAIASSNSLVDPNSNVISENKGMYTDSEVKQMLHDKNVRVAYMYEGTRPVMQFSSTIDVLDSEGEKTGKTKEVIAYKSISKENSTYYANRYLDENEQQVKVISDNLFNYFENTTGDSSMILDGANAFDINANDDGLELKTSTGRTSTVRRIGYDSKGNIIPDDNPNQLVPKSWGYRITDNMYGNSMVAADLTQAAQYLNDYVKTLNAK